MSEVKVNKISPRTNCGTVTLGDSGDTIALGSGATQTGFGRTGTVDWETTKKTGTFTATSGEGYFCDTSSGGFTVNLPAGSAGAIVSLSDYTRTFHTDNLTVSPNGSEKIGGVAANALLEIEGQTATFIYVDSTEGWINTQQASGTLTGATFITASVSGACNTLTTSGNYKIATFTGPGTFTVCSVGNAAGSNSVDYLVVAGGGGGGGGGWGGSSGYPGGAGGEGGSSNAGPWHPSFSDDARNAGQDGSNGGYDGGGGGYSVLGPNPSWWRPYVNPGEGGSGSGFTSNNAAPGQTYGGGGGGGPGSWDGGPVPSTHTGDPGAKGRIIIRYPAG